MNPLTQSYLVPIPQAIQPVLSPASVATTSCTPLNQLQESFVDAPGTTQVMTTWSQYQRLGNHGSEI